MKSDDEVVKQVRQFIKFNMDDDELYRMRDCLEQFVCEIIHTIRADERELCAKVAENFGCEYCSEGFVHDGTAHSANVVCSNDVAEAIRKKA